MYVEVAIYLLPIYIPFIYVLPANSYRIGRLSVSSANGSAPLSVTPRPGKSSRPFPTQRTTYVLQSKNCSLLLADCTRCAQKASCLNWNVWTGTATESVVIYNRIANFYSGLRRCLGSGSAGQKTHSAALPKGIITLFGILVLAREMVIISQQSIYRHLIQLRSPTYQITRFQIEAQRLLPNQQLSCLMNSIVIYNIYRSSSLESQIIDKYNTSSCNLYTAALRLKLQLVGTFIIPNR